MATTAERNDLSERLEHAEAALTLEEPAPRALRLIDQLGLWGNLGVSLLGFTGALYVLYPSNGAPLSIAAALVAIVIGTALGTAAVSAAGGGGEGNRGGGEGGRGGGRRGGGCPPRPPPH